MNKVLLKTLTLSAALLFGTGAVAAGTSSFSDLDVDGDGSLSAEEVSTVAGLDLESADTDGDGALSEEEFKTAQEEHKGGMGDSSMGDETGLDDGEATSQ